MSREPVSEQPATHAEVWTARPTGGQAPASLLRWSFLLVVVAVLQLAANGTVVGIYDEGLILYGAARVAAGDVPYRDFWTLYGPGSFYLLAGMDLTFGQSIFVGRCLDAVARAAIVTVIFALVARRCGRLMAASAAAVAFTVLIAVQEYLFVALPATAFALASMWAIDRSLRQDAQRVGASNRSWALPGSAAGMTLLFRPDFGVYVLVACVAAIWLSRRPADLDHRAVLRRLGAFGLGFIAIAGPASMALLSAVPLQDLYADVVGIPFQVYVPNRQLPFPTLLDSWRLLKYTRSATALLPLTVFIPLIVTAVGFGLVWRHRPGSSGTGFEDRTWRAFFIPLLVLDAGFCLKGSVRVQVLHFLPAMFVSIVVVAELLSCVSGRRVMRPAFALLVAAGCGLGLVGVGGAREKMAEKPRRETALALALVDRPGCVADGSRLGCFVVDDQRRLVLDYLRRHARPDDTLFVGAGRHDRLLLNNVELYFLSGLKAATRWHDLHPGVETTRAVQAEMVREMSLHPPAFVVRNSEWDAFDEPNLSRLSSGVTLLDDFLRERYVADFRVGTFTVEIPRSRSAPPSATP